MKKTQMDAEGLRETMISFAFVRERTTKIGGEKRVGGGGGEERR